MNASCTIIPVETPSWDTRRSDMREEQLRKRGILDPRVLDVMGRVPRELFVPEESRERSYQDRALAVGYGQTISQPYMTALMLQALALSGGEKVLEIGTGTGYQAALLGHLAQHVETVEIIPELADQARRILASLGLANVHVHLSDGSLGLQGAAPFDAILVAAGAPDVPQTLIDLVRPDGKLLIPLGDRRRQVLTLLQKKTSGLERETLGGCSFVPLRGVYGWPL